LSHELYLTPPGNGVRYYARLWLAPHAAGCACSQER